MEDDPEFACQAVRLAHRVRQRCRAVDFGLKYLTWPDGEVHVPDLESGAPFVPAYEGGASTQPELVKSSMARSRLEDEIAQLRAAEEEIGRQTERSLAACGEQGLKFDTTGLVSRDTQHVSLNHRWWKEGRTVLAAYTDTSRVEDVAAARAQFAADLQYNTAERVVGDQLRFVRVRQTAVDRGLAMRV